MNQKKKRRAPRGFTLIEVMLVVVIIGIMSSIAIPFYTRASARAYRSEALITISKLELYFKNIYENQGNYNGPSVLSPDSKPPGSPDVMPDPGNAVAVGQGADWKPVTGHGWDDIPFPPQGDIRMRYLYTVNNSTTPPQVTLEACGSFPGFGPTNIVFGGSGAKCNYRYTKVLQGASVDPNNGIIEVPANSFE
jgi:prepilin-type N-terminal cleavage/methylation domain-containing protein